MKNDYFKYDTRKKDIKNEYLLIKIKKKYVFTVTFLWTLYITYAIIY